MLQAQRLVAQAAGSKDNIEQAKRATEVILQTLFEHLDWQVKVVWQEAAHAQAVTGANALAVTCPQ
jgi:hypothetical protein